MNRHIKFKRRQRDPLEIGKQFHVLAERLKRDAPGRLYKSTTKNKPFFKKEQVFLIRKRVKGNRHDLFYWVAKTRQ